MAARGVMRPIQEHVTTVMVYEILILAVEDRYPSVEPMVEIPGERRRSFVPLYVRPALSERAPGRQGEFNRRNEGGVEMPDVSRKQQLFLFDRLFVPFEAVFHAASLSSGVPAAAFTACY
jgi:hypothetical protein